jgi:putative endonuclease
VVAAKDELGRRGEQLAADYLEQNGWTIASRNWRCREGELDIVAHDRRSTVVICEVKTRSGVQYGSGAEAITEAKRRRIRRLSSLWLSEYRARPDLVVRFDVISVLWGKGDVPQIQHLRSAF